MDVSTDPKLTITAFLEARIAEDEAIARSWGHANFATWQGHDHPHEHDSVWWQHHKVYDDVVSLDLSAVYGPDEPEGEYGPGVQQAYGVGEDTRLPHDVADHIVNWQPTRALSECAAKRAILAVQGNSYGDGGFPDGWWEALEEVFKVMAAPYAAHPDYRAEWSA